jgi:glycosyltransferase A (GT-A) superfamily protein (DUF2064 family)
LVFANSAPFEAKRKSLLGQHRFSENRALHQKLIDHTQAEVEKSGLDVFWFNETLQAGDTFGERIANAMHSVFQKGIEQLIIVGADSPGLRVKQISEASKQLEKGKMIIGPSLDGGVYLMAINKANFKVAVFAALPWRRNSLLGAIGNWSIENQLQLVKLKRLRDIDFGAELHTYLQQSKSKLKLVLAGILDFVRNTAFGEITPSYKKDIFLMLLPGRAPPSLLLIPIV